MLDQKRTHWSTRLVAAFLAFVMLLGNVPVNVFATETTGEEVAETPWKGRSAAFVGDSITAGTGTEKIYYEYLKEALGLGSVTAMGVGGSCISAASDYGQSTKPLIGRYQNIPSADLIMVFMGTNDYGHETPLGTAEDTQDGTFYGALNVIVPALVAKHSSSKIVFVTPIHRYGFGTSKILGTKFTYDNIPNGVGAALGDYVNAIKTVCAKNGVSVIDLHTECTLDPTDSSVREQYMPDGLHPNATGHEVIAGIMESHIRNMEPAEKAPEPETQPDEETELVYGNKFASGFTQQNRVSSRLNLYLKAGTVITLKDPTVMQWACAKTSNENSSNNLGYFPDAQWTDKETAVVETDGWVGFTFKYRDETKVFDLSKPLSDYITIEEPHVHSYKAVVTAPTCTEQGYTTYTCACGDSYVGDYVDPVWHTYADGSCSLCGCDMLRVTLEDIVRYQGGVNSENGTLNTTFTNNWYTDIRIPRGAEQVRVLTFKTGANWGSAFFDGATYLSGFCDPKVGGQWITADIPDDATVFRYGYLYDEIAQKNGFPLFEHVEFVGEELEDWESSRYMERPATGQHSFSVEVNIAPAMGDPDGYVKGTDYGYIQLPTSYTSYGEPTRLIIVCHGAGASLSTYQSNEWKATNYSFWTDLGYAVMDMYACPPELTGNSDCLHYGNPTVLECYQKGYEYVLEHFNLKRDGIFLIGSSMGGLSSFQIAQSEQFPVIAQVGYCPAIDLFKQAYCNPWTTASYQRSRIASYFDFAGTAPTFTNSKYPSAAEIEFYRQNLDKTVAYSPILRNVVDGDIASIFGVIPSSATAANAEEAAIYAQLTATHPNPLLIFHNTNDSTVAYRYSQYFVDMVNRSGQEAKLYTFTSGAHNAWANGASVTVQGINGQITIKESQYEAYKFFEKFEKHDEHQSWVDPAVKATCSTTGLTEGEHCASCGEILVAQNVIPATGEHTYENGICTGCGAENPNPYAGKTIACVGDSITCGVGVTKDETDYVTLLAKSLDMEYIRLGVSGTTLCTGGHRNCNITKLTESNLAGADVVTILMGINDFDQAKSGYYSLGTIDSKDTSTIYGAAHMWCQRIEELRKTESLADTEFYFLTPVITSWNDSVSSRRDWDQSKTNIHGYTLRDFCNAIAEVCALYDVPVIDLNLISGLYYNSSEDNTIAEFGGDGVHPGETGHRMMAAALENALLQNNLKNDHDHVYGSWITTTYPGCENGEEKRVCSVCSATESRQVDALGHTYENGTCTVCGDKKLTEITLGDFAVAGVGTGALTTSVTQLSQKTLIAVPYRGAELTVTVKDNYQVCIYSGNNNNRINQNSGWLGADGDNLSSYTYALPETSIYMRVSLRNSDGSAISLQDLELSGLQVSYHSSSNILEDNADVARILENTELPVLIHLSDIHGDTIRAERAVYFADSVGADAVLASGDLTANQPDDWGHALFDAVAKYSDVNFIYGIGNHDAQISAAAYQQTIYNSYFSNNPRTPNGETYYYQDLVDQKIRVISVNQQQGASTTTSGGTCYSQTQVDWLVETLKSTPAGYGVVMMYHSPETTIAGAKDPDYSEFFQTGNRYDNPTNSYSGYTGTFLMDLVDAFMLREDFTWSYSEKNGASPITLNADFTQIAEGVEFIAHVTGHVHSDSITYLPGTACKQLLLGVTCTTSMYGADGGYYGLADYSDLNREADNANQDAFNAYVIDRENKTVRVLRVGARQTASGDTRDDMTIPYSIPFEEGEYLFNTEGLIELDLDNVEWVNYGIQAYGVEPTYYPGQRWSTDMIFDVPYDGVTFYIKVNAPYELGIRSGKTDTTMSTNYYWLNNKSLTSGDKNRGYVYTIPADHEKFILSLANVIRDGSNNVSNTNQHISFLELQAAGLEIWYSPVPIVEPLYPFDTADKVKLDLSNVEWVNYGYQPYGPEPTYHVGTRLTTNMIFDVPYEGVTFYIKINAPYELGIRSGETGTAMDTNLGWLNNKFLSSGNSNYGFVYTIPAGHHKFILTIGNVTRNSSNNVSNDKNPITLEELEAAGLEIWFVPCTHTFENGICTVCGAEDPNAAQPMAMRYDDHLDMTGKTVEIVDAGKPTSYQVGYGVAEGTLDTAVVTLDGDTLIATGIGTAKVRIDGTLYEVTVERAKINLIVIMGQSNAGNHFANATSDVTCPIGTAHWWGNGKGTAATEPVPYTQPSMGFHTPLLAELYAQSAAVGDPVKNVMIWHEGITSKNGQSIVKWAASATDTSGTDATVTMIEKCRAYYEARSDKYEIVSSGVYWLQGESDTAMDPHLYTQQFMAMWQRLKEAGMEYLAFLRLRWGTNGNGADHQDLHYSASLSAQIKMINENPEFYMATDLTENWVGTETVTHTVDISKYITVMQAYGQKASYTDQYGNNATYADGKLTTTMKSLYGSNNKCHYGKFGYGLIGADAAYNMYRSLHGGDVAIVVTDTSGHANRKQVLSHGQAVTIDVTDMTEDLSFRVECGSAAGTLDITVKSGEEDITDRDGLIITTGQHFGAVSTDELRKIDDVSIEVTYKTVSGTSHTVTCKIDHEPLPPKADYIWDFEEDLNARGADGQILNSFLEEALNGSYTLDNGYLTGKDLQLQLEKAIELEANKNWSVEWKYGAFTNGVAGFLLCEDPGNTVGNKGLYHVAKGHLMISDYADSNGYRNYTSQSAKISENDCLKLTNRYDPDTGKSTISLWINNELVVADFQQKGSLNKYDDNLDMTQYPLVADFDFRYLGNKGMTDWRVNCQLDYLKISFGEETEAAQPMSMKYDDHVDMTGKTVEIIDAGKPISYQVGYGVAEGTLDTAVVTLDGDTLIATGIGTAKVRIDGTLYEVSVTAAPISLLLLIGQSNMQGIDGNASESIVCEDGMVYATYADRYKKTVEDVTKFAPSALTGQYSNLNVTGDTACLEKYPVNMLTEAGNGREGMDSGIAYEWVKQTGEKVWTVNVGYGGSSINEWLEGGVHYEACLELFSACQETLRKEIAAGHFTLSHMAYFWCQGCADETQTAKWYVDKFLTMHNALKSKMAFSNEKTFEFAGIVPIRSGHSGMGSYRAGVYKDTTNVPYYQSFKDLRFNGPRVAQYWMGNNPELADIWNVCTIQEGWATLPDGTNGVAAYFQTAYQDGVVDYTTQVKQSAGWYKPTTPAAVHDNIHYNQIGYNEIGREAARNALILMGKVDVPNAEATVEFVSWDGFTPASEVNASTAGHSATLVVPMVSPVWKSKEVTYTVTDGLRYEYYDLLADSSSVNGKLTAEGAQGSVLVDARALTSYCWTFDGSNLVSDTSGQYTENVLTRLAGSVTDGKFSGMRYQTSYGIQLLHNKEWALDVQISNWSSTSGSMVLSSGQDSKDGQPYVYFRPVDYFVGIGCYNGATYDNYGISLKNHGIACGEGTHTYRFLNRIAEDGSNMIYLFVDGKEIGALTDHYVNSTLSDRGNSWVSGKDFAMPYFGTSTAPISGCVIDSIFVCEEDFDADIHIHSWSAWETVSAPGPEGPGTEQRKCACGETQTREVEGVWQTLKLSEHMTAMPDEYCCATNLWTAMEHDKYYFGTNSSWSIHQTGTVYSVTIPISAGDQIFATSFGATGENGGAKNGIITTFFNATGVEKMLMPADTYAEFVTNGGYLIAPENTVAANLVMWTNSDENELYILNREHDYKGTTCTICGSEHPEKADYKGKVISIMGDSISTFAGYIPVADGFNLAHRTRYPDTSRIPDVTDVNQTWWMQVINELDAKLGINESWAGSTIYWGDNMTTKNADTGEKAAMASLTRIQNLGSNGTPDVIFLYGGGNDKAKGVKVGSFDPATVPAAVDLTATKWDTFADSCVAAIMRMQHYYPDAQIVVLMSIARSENAYISVMREICEHFDVPFLFLNEYGLTPSMHPDGSHPNTEGMDVITEAILGELMEQCDAETGENVVYSVKHDLTNAQAEKHYYKGISAGEVFTETVTGDNVNVQVTMDGKDITETAYAGGKITIASVSGDVVITATGVYNCDGHLQQLPDRVCAGTNIWTELEPENIYYTVNGWGLFDTQPDVHSVTFPVEVGERIWATSFGKTAAGVGTRITWFGQTGVLKTVSRDVVYAEFQKNGYVTVPAGATAVNIPMGDASKDREIYLLDRDHIYENGRCTECGEVDYSNHNYKGKVISILSASTSTFAGYIPVADGFNLEHRSRYPQDNLLTDVNDTWWMQVINQLDAKLGINDSWAGSQVLNNRDTNSGDLGPDAAMASLTRIQNLGANGTPDVILFFGGGNDMGRGVTLGSFDPETAPTEVDLTTKKWNNFADAYVAAIMRLQHFYPDTEIVVMTTYPMPSYVTAAKLNKYGPVIKAICDHYGVKYVDLRDCGVTFDMLPDKIHPNAEGMDYITAAVMDALISDVEMEAGENVVHSVNHNLSNAVSSLHYYKGISHGKPFKTAITGENLTVTVTMGGEDITRSVYADGVVNIPSVTGDLIITAKGKFDADGHLQQLPEKMCAGINLWTALEPENIYYTATGWGNTTAGTTWSITFPVQPGDRIWATSLGAYPENGSGANGVRVTWFNEDGVLATLDRNVVYEEFAKNGYITAPQGAVALNLPMTNNQAHYAVYILNAEHTYESEVTAPTCTEQGYTTHTCTICGDSYVDSYVNATGHEFGDWSVTIEPTCTEKGEERRDCSSCVHFETREVVATGHDYEAVVTAPTCTEKGFTTHTCHCGNSYIDSYVDATGHKFGEWTVTIEPTCTEKGEERRDCANCDHFETREIAATGHDYEAVVTKPTCTERGFTTHTCHCGDSYDDSYVDAVGHKFGEWTITKVPTCTEKGVEQRDCENCDHFETREVDAIDHDYEAVVTKPTCTEKGYTTHTCHCGDSYIDSYVDATGHKFGHWTVTTEPSCTEKSEERRDCENCDHFETREVEATGHDYETVVTKPTCSDKGFTTHTCHCGDSYVDSYVDAAGHKFREWTVTIEPTCTDNGKERRDCDNCDHFETREVEAIGHDYEAVVTAPTCEEKGYTTHTCHCGDSYIDSYVDATGHKFGNWAVVNEPTCTEKGEESRDCANCDHFETREVEATGHDHETVVTKPTCVDKGFTTHTCHCGDSYVDSYVNALGHEYGEWYVTKQATLESEGEERRDCDRYDDFQTRKIPKLVHNYTSIVTAPTCTEQGYTTHTCQNCGDTYVDTYVNALGHSFVDYVSNDDATCTVDGTKTAKCERCDETDTIRDVGTAKGHKFSDWEIVEEPTCTEKGEEQRDCENCDHFETREVDATGHDYEAVVTEPTCEDKGYTTHTCHCGDSYIDSYVDAVGHEFGDWTVTTEATCTEKGAERRDCEYCDHFETHEVAAIGHDYDAVVTNPTCTERGYTTHICSKCDDNYVDSYVNATGHKFGDWEIVDEPTCTEKGMERRDCENCDHFEIREIAATGHDYEAVVTAPTCTEKGYTTHTCHCGDSYINGYVEAIGHKFGEWTVITEPNCTEKGMERRECENCDHFESREVAATGHDYEAVVTEPTCEDKGYTTHTCHCSDSYIDGYVEAIGHKFGEWTVITEPTCTVKGMERRECENCDHFETREVAADGHDYEAVVTVPTCTEKGYTTHTCSKCGDSYADSYVHALGHRYENGSCSICGEPEVKYLLGDVDLDGDVDVDDVLALLWYVLFPEDYPIEVDADFDRNGSTDVDDVLTLLWYVLFPEDYPLN